MGLFMPFSSYYLWYLIDRFGFVIDDVTEISVFSANDNGLFTKFRIQLMEERMKATEQKNDGYGTFCKNILNIIEHRAEPLTVINTPIQDNVAPAETQPVVKHRRILHDDN
jgi:hypothetical protein